MGGREVPSGRAGLGLSGRRTGTASQPVEGKTESCAAEALGMGDIGVPASLFCHTDEKMDLQPLHGGRGGGSLCVMMGTTEAPLVTTAISLCPSKLAVL